MLRHGADPNTALPRNGRTPLHACAEAGFPDGVEALLRVRGVDADPKDKKGRQTPLYLAAKSGNLSAVRMLVEANADLDHHCFGKTVGETVKDNFPGNNDSHQFLRLNFFTCCEAAVMRNCRTFLMVARRLSVKTVPGDFVDWATAV